MPRWGIDPLVEKVALVAIDNGLGHLKRQVIIAELLVKSSLIVDVFCNTDNLKKIACKKKANYINLRVNVRDLLNKSINIKSKFANSNYLQEYDLVVCDNFLEVLELRSDAWIMASFFWHRVFEDVDRSYYRYCENLLSKSRPFLIGNYLFLADYLKCYSRLKKIGLFTLINRHPSKGNGILISTGLGGEDNDMFHEVVDRTLLVAENRGYKVFVEEKLMNTISSKVASVASFDNSMYSNVFLGLCRPGVGTISDLLAVGAYPLCIYEKSNLEMEHNADVLFKNGLGDSIETIEELETFFSKFSERKRPRSFQDLKFSGPNDFLSLVKEKFL